MTQTEEKNSRDQSSAFSKGLPYTFSRCGGRAFSTNVCSNFGNEKVEHLRNSTTNNNNSSNNNNNNNNNSLGPCRHHRGTVLPHFAQIASIFRFSHLLPAIPISIPIPITPLSAAPFHGGIALSTPRLSLVRAEKRRKSAIAAAGPSSWSEACPRGIGA